MTTLNRETDRSQNQTQLLVQPHALLKPHWAAKRDFIQPTLIPRKRSFASTLAFVLVTAISACAFAQDTAEYGQNQANCKEIASAEKLGAGTSSAFGAAAAKIEVVGAKSKLWSLNPFERGNIIHKALGENLPHTFPGIDKWLPGPDGGGTIVSIKSLNLEAPTYQNAEALARTLKGYIDTVAKFTSRTWNQVTVPPVGGKITGRVLELAVPACTGTTAQQGAFKIATDYAKNAGVVIEIVKI